jgi:hypothetical protein
MAMTIDDSEETSPKLTAEEKREITAVGQAISTGVRFARDYLLRHPEVRAEFERSAALSELDP